MKQRFLNFGSLHEAFREDTQDFIKEAKYRGISLSKYLNFICNIEEDVVIKLLMSEGLFPNSDMREYYKENFEYKRALLKCFFDDVYDKCFLGTDDFVGLDDICEIKDIEANYYRLNKMPDISSVSESDMVVPEGTMIPVIDMPYDKSVITMRCIALGIRWTIESCIRNATTFQDYIDIVKDIGKAHFNIMFNEAMRLLLDRLEPVEFDGGIDENIIVKGLEGITLNEYFRISHHIRHISDTDTILGSVLPTSRYMVSNLKATEIKNNIKEISGGNTNLFQNNNTVKVLSGNNHMGLTDSGNALRRLLVYKKRGTLLWLRGKPYDDMRDIFDESRHLLTFYFMNLYGFHMRDDNTRFLVNLNTDNVENKIINRWEYNNAVFM